MKKALVLMMMVSISTMVLSQSTTRNANTNQYFLISDMEQQLTKDQFISTYSERMGLSEQDDLVLVRSTKGNNSYEHHRYKQYHNNLEVYGVEYIIHEKDGIVRSANGTFASYVEVEDSPTLSSEEALKIAMIDMGAKEYTWESSEQKALLNNDKPIPYLCIIDEALPQFSGQHRLVYRIDLFSQEPMGGEQYFIDAIDGSVIKTIPLLHDSGIPCSCQTRYYGEQEMILDSLSPTLFELFDDSRGDEGIGVIDFDGEKFQSTEATFGEDSEAYVKAATDAQYCTTELYDDLVEHFDWRGVDGNDKSFKIGVYAREREDFVNAFWNGETAWIGNGNCNNGPLATFEVVAHELMHGIIDYTSDLIYSDESGAINESMADIMGHAMEFLNDEPNFSWDLNSFILNDLVEPFRIMDDPNQKEHPALYKGLYWEDGANVHINSSIGNLFYVLLSEGRTGTNEVNETFNITGMGQLEAAKFVFHVNKNYLVPSSGYNDYYHASILAADEWFDGSQSTIANINAAWAYVGLPSEAADNEMDLAVSSDGFFRACGFGTVQSTWFELENVGGLDYLPTGQATVRVTEGFGADNLLTEITLSDTILVGETLRVNLDSLITIDDDFIVINYELVFPLDLNEGNNEENDYISTTEYEFDDMRIDLRTAAMKCFSNDLDLEFLVYNAGCEEIEAGKTITLKVTDTSTGEVIFSEELITEDRIIPNSRIIIDRTTQISLQDNATLMAEVIYADDPNLQNNEAYTDLYIVTTVTEDYYNGFGDATEADQGLSIRIVDPFRDFIVSYQQDEYFMTTGYFSDSDDVLCEDVEKNFTGDVEDIFSGMSASLTLCADLSAEAQPMLNFNLAQFTNDNLEFAAEQSSALEVKWGEEENEATYIYGQDEGLVESHTIDLPPFFRGPLELNFFTLTGVDNLDLFYANDSQLLDDLHFGNSVSAEDLEEKVLDLIPNPVISKLYIATTEKIEKLQVVDLQGRLVYEGGGENILDVSNLSSGCYHLKVLTESGENMQEKFIVVKE